MGRSTDLVRARAILGDDFLGPEELERALGAAGALDVGRLPAVPFAEDRLAAGTKRGELLILRAACARGEPLTLLRLIERFPDAFDARFLKSMGYQLKSEWGIELEPLAATETCRPGWSLVRKSLLAETCNLSFGEQEERLVASASEAGDLLARRRSAVEIVFDLIAFQRARGRRLLADSWDWSGSRTIDGGYLNVGHFDEHGMQIFSFSPGVRHGKLGICPNVDGAA
jgi:hypothetical protein